MLLKKLLGQKREQLHIVIRSASRPLVKLIVTLVFYIIRGGRMTGKLLCLQETLAVNFSYLILGLCWWPASSLTGAHSSH